MLAVIAAASAGLGASPVASVASCSSMHLANCGWGCAFCSGFLAGTGDFSIVCRVEQKRIAYVARRTKTQDKEALACILAF